MSHSRSAGPKIDFPFHIPRFIKGGKQMLVLISEELGAIYGSFDYGVGLLIAIRVYI